MEVAMMIKSEYLPMNLLPVFNNLNILQINRRGIITDDKNKPNRNLSCLLFGKSFSNCLNKISSTFPLLPGHYVVAIMF